MEGGTCLRLGEAEEDEEEKVVVAGDVVAEVAEVTVVAEAKVESKVLMILTILQRPTLPRNGGVCLHLSKPKLGRPERRIG